MVAAEHTEDGIRGSRVYTYSCLSCPMHVQTPALLSLHRLAPTVALQLVHLPYFDFFAAASAAGVAGAAGCEVPLICCRDLTYLHTDTRDEQRQQQESTASSEPRTSLSCSQLQQYRVSE